MVVVRSTFLDVVDDEEVGEHHCVRRPCLRRSRTDPTSLQRAWDEKETKLWSDSSPVVYVLEGETWQKCSQSESQSTIPSSTASDSDEQRCIPGSVSSTQASLAMFEATHNSASDSESPFSGHNLPSTHAPSEELVSMREQTKRTNQRCQSKLPFELASGTLQEASKRTSGIGKWVPSFADAKAFVVPEPVPVSLMCTGQWCLPTVAAPTLLTSQHSAGTLVHFKGVMDNLEHQRTTLMLRNLPNNYSRDLVIQLLNEHGFAGKYDFLYFPIDFQTGCGLGFAFVNCITHSDACLVKGTLNGFQKWAIPSSKVCTVGWSGNDQQGLVANTERYRNSSVMHKSVPEASKPVIFKNGVRAKFPCSTKKLWPPSCQHGSRVRQPGSAQRKSSSETTA